LLPPLATTNSSEFSAATVFHLQDEEEKKNTNRDIGTLPIFVVSYKTN
jgi:hypothetical protein